MAHASCDASSLLVLRCGSARSRTEPPRASAPYVKWRAAKNEATPTHSDCDTASIPHPGATQRPRLSARGTSGALDLLRHIFEIEVVFVVRSFDVFMGTIFVI